MITLAGIRPLALTCIPCARAHERMASDRPGGAVLAATFCRGAPTLPWAVGALRAAALLPGTFLAVDIVAGATSTTALVADALSETDLLLPFAACFLSPASFPLRPAADRLDGFFAAPRGVDSTGTLGPDGSSFFRTRTCRP